MMLRSQTDRTCVAAIQRRHATTMNILAPFAAKRRGPIRMLDSEGRLSPRDVTRILLYASIFAGSGVALLSGGINDNYLLDVQIITREGVNFYGILKLQPDSRPDAESKYVELTRPAKELVQSDRIVLHYYLGTSDLPPAWGRYHCELILPGFSDPDGDGAVIDPQMGEVSGRTLFLEKGEAVRFEMPLTGTRTLDAVVPDDSYGEPSIESALPVWDPVRLQWVPGSGYYSENPGHGHTHWTRKEDGTDSRPRFEIRLAAWKYRLTATIKSDAGTSVNAVVDMTSVPSQAGPKAVELKRDNPEIIVHSPEIESGLNGYFTASKVPGGSNVGPIH